MSSERKHREEIVRYGRTLHERGLVAAMDGNLSVRLKNDNILVTPTCVSKGNMRAADMVVVDMDGHRVSGRRNVTSEIGMHLLIYRMRPDIQAIVHAHPPTATGFAAAGIALTQPLVCEVVMGLGCIPLARYGTPGTSELARTLEPFVPHYDAILMSNHGVVAYGDTLERAYMKMETVEHFAQIALVTHLLGRQQPLQEVEVQKLLVARAKYFGAKMASSMPLPMHSSPEKAS
ncbi:MAG: class II aldolase/adducin family protein [Candidatus Sulfotelmatobacter sp.]|jgi:L-fuculose-phosphate aldolase